MLSSTFKSASPHALRNENSLYNPELPSLIVYRLKIENDVKLSWSGNNSKDSHKVLIRNVSQ